MNRSALSTAVFVLSCSASAQNVGDDAKAPEKIPADAAASASTTSPPPPTQAPATKTKISGGYVHQFDTSISPNGSYTADRAFGGFSSQTPLADNLSLSVGLGYEYDHYNFSGINAFTATAWNNVNSLGVVPRFDIRIDDHWAVGAVPILQLSGEASADAWRSITGGGLANFRYAFDETHVLGLGLLVKGQLDNSVLVVPVPLVDWEIIKGLRISNLRAPEANPFVGIELVQELGPDFNVAIGGAWEYRMFRLDNSGPNPNGVGQEQQVSVYGRLEWRPAPQFRVDFLAGAVLMNQLKLRTSSNNLVASEDGGTALVLGVFASFKF